MTNKQKARKIVEALTEEGDEDISNGLSLEEISGKPYVYVPTEHEADFLAAAKEEGIPATRVGLLGYGAVDSVLECGLEDEDLYRLVAFDVQNQINVEKAISLPNVYNQA